MSSDGLVYATLLFRQGSVNEPHILSANGMGLELFRESQMGCIPFGNHEETGGLFVQSVDDSWSKLAADPGEVLTAKQESIDQCVASMTRRRMYHHAGRLVDYEQVLVFVQNIQRYGFGGRLRGGWGGHFDADLLRGPQTVGRLDVGVVDPDRTPLDKLLNLMARDELPCG
jgi:hypothetical protein